MLADFCEHWRQHGAEAIGRVYEKDPAEYVKLAVALLPKQVAVDATAQQVVYHISDQVLSPEEWIAKYRDPVAVIGYLSSHSSEADASTLFAFRRGLNDAGFTDGRNAVIEYRYGGNDAARLSELAADLVNRRVAVIATVGGLTPARAAKAASGTIPIVFEVELACGSTKANGRA